MPTTIEICVILVEKKLFKIVRIGWVRGSVGITRYIYARLDLVSLSVLLLLLIRYNSRALHKMPLIQLRPHAFTVIPSHPSLSTDTSRPEPKEFVGIALREAVELLHSIPSTFTTDPKPRASPPSQTKVHLLRAWRNSDKEKPEFWVARQSKHVDARTEGTASWSEFEAGLRTDHAEHEMEYTPSVSGVERLLEWPGHDIGEVEVDGVTYKDVVFESKCHFHKTSKSVSDVHSQSDNAFLPPICPDFPTQLHLPDYLRIIRVSIPIATNLNERLHHRSNTPAPGPFLHPI